MGVRGTFGGGRGPHDDAADQATVDEQLLGEAVLLGEVLL